MSGLPAALWLLGLFAAAPALRTSARYDFSDRLRDALIVGIAIPFALGPVHALYAVACWCALAICIAVAYARGIAKPAKTPSAGTPTPYLLIGALLAVAWPQLMRPLLEGDSLSYHLPNAASWVQAHSIWTTATRYWWYPPASELFAAGLYVTSGPFALPWCGFVALALLGFRITAWVRSAFGAPPLLADLLAAATVTAFPLAIQAGTLQNDVWLAAFWLEALWALLTSQSATAARALAVTALIKPQGWLFAVIALIATKGKRGLWITTLAALALWLARDAILWRHAIVAPASTEYGSLFGSTILAHGWAAFAILARVTLAASPFASVALLAALAGPYLSRRERRLGWAACAAALLFFLLPFGYASSVAQLATGASLRFAAPAVAAGAVILTALARRNTVTGAALLAASTLFGVGYVLAIFWNDAPTRVAPVVALAGIGAVAWARALRRGWPIALAFVAIAVAADFLAGSHPVDFYDDALRVNGRPTAFYSWVERTRPTAIGAVGLALGTVNVLSPQTRTVEIPDASSCARASGRGVLLVAIAENDRAADFNLARLREARACGVARYDDGIAVVVAPSDVR
ncbi:MAG: hypothetical protein WCC84_14510 [Candidatus Cybelea sp.]